MRQLPIGIDDFEKLRENGYYYVDKTLLIKDLLDNSCEVSVFMRPRRFGKTLALSMLKCFFEGLFKNGNPEGNRNYLFEGLKIMEAGEKYTRHMGKYPVISLSLKSAKQDKYSLAYECLIDELAEEFGRHNDILASDKLFEEEKEQFIRIRSKKGTEADYAKALEFLSRCLRKAYGKKAIILIDEYDVPLENAWFRGFYQQMSDFIRSLFESALKTNPNLEFAVITGCLRISRESIFTGLNNLDMISVLNRTYGEHFGFTDAEVSGMLNDYGICDKKEELKKWYDGYLFGETEVYNPWSAIHYVRAVVQKEEVPLKPYWVNTSSNDIVRELIERADHSTRQELETLIAGGTIEKPIHEDITYEEIYQSQDNLWNFMFFTGYLKKVRSRFVIDTIYVTMAIPNMEVRYIYRSKVMEWYDKRIRHKDLTTLYQALLRKDCSVLEQEISSELMETISFFDYKEAYYHGYLAGLLKSMNGYLVRSNRESGLGRSDISVCSSPYDGVAIIIETKVADNFGELESKAQEALQQITERQYDTELKQEGYRTFIHYGVAFFGKLCKILCE